MHSRLSSLLLIGLVVASLFLIVPVYGTTTETRYMTNDASLTLSTTETSTLNTTYIATSTIIYMGIRVYIIHSNGSETFVLGQTGQTSAVVSLSAGTNTTTTINAGFTVVNNESMVSTDKVRVWVFGDISNPPTAYLYNFTTGELGASQLDNGTWTVYYRIWRKAKVGTFSQFYFLFGTSAQESYVTNFSYEPSVGKVWNTVSTWIFQLPTRQWNSLAWISTLSTRQWFGISWAFNTSTMQWNSVTWLFNLTGMEWHSVQWDLQAVARAWQSLTWWAFTLDTLGWHSISWVFNIGPETNIPVLFVGLAFFGSLALAVIGWRLKKRKT